TIGDNASNPWMIVVMGGTGKAKDGERGNLQSHGHVIGSAIAGDKELACSDRSSQFEQIGFAGQIDDPKVVSSFVHFYKLPVDLGFKRSARQEKIKSMAPLNLVSQGREQTQAGALADSIRGSTTNVQSKQSAAPWQIISGTQFFA